MPRHAITLLVALALLAAPLAVASAAAEVQVSRSTVRKKRMNSRLR